MHKIIVEQKIVNIVQEVIVKGLFQMVGAIRYYFYQILFLVMIRFLSYL